MVRYGPVPVALRGISTAITTRLVVRSYIEVWPLGSFVYGAADFIKLVKV